MADYSALSSNELINLLNQKDNELINQTNEIEYLKKQISTIQNPTATDGVITNKTASSIILDVLDLEDSEKKLLPSLLRTTTEGIKAYTTFLYGNTNTTESIDDVTTVNL